MDDLGHRSHDFPSIPSLFCFLLVLYLASVPVLRIFLQKLKNLTFSLVEFNEYNDALFNIRARSLNNLVYWLSEIVTAISIGLILDQKGLRRRVRAFFGWAILLAVVFIVHIWAFFYQRYVFNFSFHHNNKIYEKFSIDIIQGPRFPRILVISSTSLIIDTPEEYGYIYYVVLSMRCGKQRHTGSLALCLMILQNCRI